MPFPSFSAWSCFCQASFILKVSCITLNSAPPSASPNHPSFSLLSPSDALHPQSLPRRCWKFVSQLMTGCVTCHTCHGCVTHFRPILGNIVEVTLVTSPIMYIVSHAKGASFP